MVRSLALLVALAGCGSDAPPASPGVVVAPATAEPLSSRERSGREAPEEHSGATKLYFDLATHLERAEIREGETLVVDFGVPGGAKHTLGGWQTESGREAVHDGTTELLAGGERFKLIVPIARDGAHVIKLRVRGEGPMTVYFDGETVAHARLGPAYSIVRVALPAATRGEHFVQLRGHEGELAIDWMRIAPLPVEPADSSPPALGATMALPRDSSVGYALEVPPRARLTARIAAEGTARAALDVRVARDGREDIVLPLRAGSGTRDVDLDLAAFEGEVVRLDLVASEGPLRIEAPRIVTTEPEQAPRARPPAMRNAIIVLVDTLRADKLHVYEPTTRVRTPGLDDFARSAAVFLQGHTQENWTKPSVATLLSGLMPWEHRATTDDAVVPASVDTLPEILRRAGFHTGAFVANGYVSEKFGFDQGFGSLRNYIREGRRTQASFVAADVLAWLDARPQDQPFFLYVHTIDPHVPYLPPREVLETYDPDPYDGVVDFGRDRGLLERIKAGSLRLDERDRTHLTALYDAEITYHDVHFDSIIEGLARRGLDRDTLVVFTADHGEELFDHGSVGHGHSVFEELLHVPLIFNVPGLTDQAMRIDAPAGLVDVTPTVLDLLGREAPAGLSGRSLVPLMLGERDAAPRPVVSGFMDGWRTIVLGRYKLVQRTASRVLLYDLVADPDERTDLAAQRPLTVRYLRGLLGLVLSGATRGPREHVAETTTIDADTDAQLRALGYVGSSRPR